MGIGGVGTSWEGAECEGPGWEEVGREVEGWEGAGCEGTGWEEVGREGTG